MQRIEENNEVRAVINMILPGIRPRGRQRGRWIGKMIQKPFGKNKETRRGKTLYTTRSVAI